MPQDITNSMDYDNVHQSLMGQITIHHRLKGFWAEPIFSISSWMMILDIAHMETISTLLLSLLSSLLLSMGSSSIWFIYYYCYYILYWLSYRILFFIIIIIVIILLVHSKHFL